MSTKTRKEKEFYELEEEIQKEISTERAKAISSDLSWRDILLAEIKQSPGSLPKTEGGGKMIEAAFKRIENPTEQETYLEEIVFQKRLVERQDDVEEEEATQPT